MIFSTRKVGESGARVNEYTVKTCILSFRFDYLLAYTDLSYLIQTIEIPHWIIGCTDRFIADMQLMVDFPNYQLSSFKG